MMTQRQGSHWQLSLIAAAIGLLGAAWSTPLPAQEADKPRVATQQLLDELLAMPTQDTEAARKLRDQIWRACARRHGDLGPLLEELRARLEKKPDRPLVLRLLRLKAHYLHRLGDLAKARRALEKIQESEESSSDILTRAELLDALGRNKQAIATYDRLLQRPLEARLKSKILLRKALMASATKKPAGRGKEKEKEKEPSALARFAALPGQTPELRNQAAAVLALTNEQKEAIKVFTPSGEGTARFRQELRLAEWAIEAGAWPKAQESAWKAVQSAKLKRDRRYGLTTLVEAYRRAGKLDALIERFAKAEKLDLEARETWIDLLRERGKVEEALGLFRQAKQGEFTANMRRELLEICRETNQDQVLEDAYQKMIAEEPRFIEWREGLARFHLERGRRQAALAVWDSYLEETGDFRYRMAAASTLMGLGLDDLAVHFARSSMAAGSQTNKESALLFLYELHQSRGRHAEARQALEELDRSTPAGAGARKEMADAYARLGDKAKAVEVLEKLYAALGESTTPDTRMKLALMLSGIGKEDQALDHWQSLWRQINSIPRRRYVEERLMSVASRLGKLAKIAIALEKKLVAGTADDRDAGLLVRLYIKVNDPVSATEIIEEHMKKVGKKPVEVLTEKARVFQSCNDFYNYEKVVEQLIAIDKEGRPDYLRQLAMSNMERGQRLEARAILERLKQEESDSVSDEFEAGVLALAGMRDEAIACYRRGIAKYPERIDTYLLLSNIQRELGRHDRSAGMFQYLAATAEKDDLFTIAIDGILNMRDGRANRGAPNRLVEWARRVVLERVARRPNKLYLYRLVADLSEELNDVGMAIRALKAAVPVAGEQRTQLLRELMTMAKQLAGRSRPSFQYMSPVMAMRMGYAQTQKDKPPNADLLMFGRRILGQAEIVPPQTYLELGAAFLAAGEVANASQTFNQASQLPEFAEMRRKFAQAFELALFPKEALRVYEQILSVENGDVGLIAKVGELLEQTGRDGEALELYRRGLELLLDRSVFTRTGVKKEEAAPEAAIPRFYGYGNRNTDEWDRHNSWLTDGLLATLSEPTAETFLASQKEQIKAELARIAKEREAGTIPRGGQLLHHPRLARRITLYRRIAVAFGHIEFTDRLDRGLLLAFEKDATLLEQMVRFRLSWGYVVSARRLITESKRPEPECKRLRLLAGARGSIAVPGLISVVEAAGLLLPLLVEGRQDTAKALLERLDLSTGDKAALEHMPMLVGGSIFLREPDLTLTLCRHWLNLSVRHNPGSMYATVESVLRQGRMMLDEAQLRSLTEHMLVKITENPDRFTVFIRRLPELRDKAGPDFLTRDQIEKLIRSRLEASDRFIHGIEELFVLLAPEDRSPVLRSVWNKLPKTQRAYFLLRLVSVLDHELDKGFAEFLAAAFSTALTDADDKRMLGYQVNNLAVVVKVNRALRLELIDAMIESGEAGAMLQAGRAILQLELGRKQEARKAIGEVFAAAFASRGGSPADPMARSAFYNLINSLGKDHADELLRAFDKVEKEQQKQGQGQGQAAEKANLELTRRRLDLLRQLGQNEAMLEALRQAVRRHPKDLNFRSQLASSLSSRGAQGEAVTVRAQGVKLLPENKSLRQQLVAGWRMLRHPIKALAVRSEGEKQKEKPKEKSKTATNAAAKKKRTPPANLLDVKKAVEAKNQPLAQTTFRRLWRRYSPRTNDPYGRAYSHRRFGAGARLLWPKDQAKRRVATPASARVVRPGRGGLPELFTRELKPTEKRRTRFRQRFPMGVPGVGRSTSQTDPRKKPKKPTTAHAVLAKKDFGRPEIERQLRSMLPTQLGSIVARDIYEALVTAEVERLGREKVLLRLLARERAGHSGKIDYGMLAVLLDDPSKASPAWLEQSLSGLTDNLDPRDQAQLRRLARLHARSGNPAKASTLYGWAALSASGRRFGYYPGADDLLYEVIENLKGPERLKAVEAVLAYSDPGEYGRDPYLRVVLETWMDLLDPQEALAKSRRVLGEVRKMEMLPLRQSCKLAAFLHARAGEIEDALACLEIALCKLEPPAQTRYPRYRSSFERAGSVSTYDIAMLFPFEMKGFLKPGEWLVAVQEKVLAWMQARRLNDRLPLQLLSVLALRLHGQGRTELAQATLAQAQELAKDSSQNLLWIADVARLISQAELADRIERRLFDEGRLQVERVPEIIARVIESEGAEKGLALGEKAATMTLHPDLLKHLVAASKTTGQSKRATHWEKVQTQAQAAKKRLQEQDRERAEKARKERGR